MSISSTAGGSVPSQGVVIDAPKRRARCEGKPAGYTFGKGKPGKRLRGAYRKATGGSAYRKATGGIGLRKFVRGLLKTGDDEQKSDAKAWMQSKGMKA